MKRLFTFIFSLIMVSNILHSQENLKKIGIDYFEVDSLLGKVVLRPIKYPNTIDNYVFHQDINEYEGAYLLRNIETLEFQFFIYNYFTNKIYEKKIIDKKNLTNLFYAVYFTKDFFYTLEKYGTSVILIKRLNNGESIGEFHVDMNHRQNIKSMIVNEEKNILIITLLNNVIEVYSLNTGNCIYADKGKLLYNISNETSSLLYSQENKIYVVDFNEKLQKQIIDTFIKSPKEEIVELVKVNNNYVIVTRRIKKNLFINFVFNTVDWENIYYFCIRKDDKLVKVKEIHKKNNGIIFN